VVNVSSNGGARVRAPEAFAAKISARRASAGPNADGHFMKKLLYAFRAEQRMLEFFYILSAVFMFTHHKYTHYLMRDLAHPRVIWSATYYPLAAAQTPAARSAAFPDLRIRACHNELTSVTG
jgi:hypothetical protein